MSYDKLTAFVPAHKQAHPEHKPGQIVNPLGFVDTTLSPKKLVSEKQKLTFDEWFLSYIGMPFEDWDANLQEDDMRACWRAAQENV